MLYSPSTCSQMLDTEICPEDCPDLAFENSSTLSYIPDAFRETFSQAGGCARLKADIAATLCQAGALLD